MKPIFDENGLASAAGDIRCFYYDAMTGEYKGWSDEHINIGVSMPGNSTAIDPGEEVTGFVAVFSDDSWEKQPDNRGETVYSTENGRSTIVGYIGEIKDGFTAVAPSTQYDVWNGSEWVTNTDAQHAADVAAAAKQKTTLLAEASAFIAPLADAAAGGYIDDADKPTLAAWQRYRYELTKIDTSTAPDIEWPPLPN
ncbi:TPA: tail fiber assembly protein [Kluyvera georgiana]